jgi:hypothetical protein
MGFVGDKMVLGQVFSEYFSFPANSHSTSHSILINDPMMQCCVVSVLIASLNNKHKKKTCNCFTHFCISVKVYPPRMHDHEIMTP